MNILKRRKQLMIVSGTLLVAGLIAGHGLGHSAVAAVLLILASIVAGSDIVVRAWNSLRVKHISIELLVTLAATGGIAIGIYEEAAAVTFLLDRKSTRLNSSHVAISYAVFCLKKKK